MTPTEETAFITLWAQGASYATIAAALHIPTGTVGSRAHALAKQGKIQARPKGGAYPRQAQRRQASPTHAPVQGRAGQSGAVQNSAEPSPTALVPSPAIASAAIIDLLRQTLARLDTVEQDLKAIREDRQPGAVQDSAEQGRAEQSGAETPALSPDEARAERWNLWLPRGLRQRIEAVAQARGHAPSKVVQELLWKALTDRR
jgi:hypothetical protein